MLGEGHRSVLSAVLPFSGVNVHRALLGPRTRHEGCVLMAQRRALGFSSFLSSAQQSSSLTGSRWPGVVLA